MFIIFLGFGEEHILGGILPNLIAFGLFVGAFGHLDGLCWQNGNKIVLKKSSNE